MEGEVLMTVRARTAEGPKNLPRFLLSLRLIHASKTVGFSDGKQKRERKMEGEVAGHCSSEDGGGAKELTSLPSELPSH